MRLIVCRGPEHLGEQAARVVRERLRARPELAMAVPAGRTPRRMYARLHELQREDPVDFSRTWVFPVDELCPPAPVSGYFWNQVRREFLEWAGISGERCHPFRLDADDLEEMCRAQERVINDLGGLDLVMLGLGPNAHLASNEPGTPFDSRTRPASLTAETVGYIRTDEENLRVAGGAVSDRAVTLGLATIAAAREVVVLVAGPHKRNAMRRLVQGPVGPAVPASVLRLHAGCTVLADEEACP